MEAGSPAGWGKRTMDIPKHGMERAVIVKQSKFACHSSQLTAVASGIHVKGRQVLWVNTRLPLMLGLLLSGNACKASPGWTGPCDQTIGIGSPGDQNV